MRPTYPFSFQWSIFRFRDLSVIYKIVAIFERLNVQVTIHKVVGYIIMFFIKTIILEKYLGFLCVTRPLT